jgi:hypothetical protein
VQVRTAFITSTSLGILTALLLQHLVLGAHAEVERLGDPGDDSRLNWMDGTVSIFTGHPGRTFTPFATLPVPAHSETVLITDITQDGRADLIVTGSGELSATSWVIRIYPGLDHGLGAAIDVPAGLFPRTLAVADLDSDGRRDLIAVAAARLPSTGRYPVAAWQPHRVRRCRER